MTQRGLFRVLMRAIGLYFSIEGAVMLVYHGLSIAYTSMSGNSSSRWLESVLLSIVYSLGQLLAGLYLVFGGRLVLDQLFPRGTDRCHECGYDLSRTTAPVCPECATKIPAKAAEPGA